MRFFNEATPTVTPTGTPVDYVIDTMAAVAAGKVDDAIFILKALSAGITFINEILDSGKSLVWRENQSK